MVAALVVINGDDVYEDLFAASLELQGIVTDAGFATGLQMGMGRFTDTSSRVDDIDLVVLYTAMGEFDLEQQHALARAVAAGTGLIAIHASNVFASTGARIADGYLTAFDLMGSRYVSHGPHPHESRFTVSVDRSHPITAGLEPFAVTHEHYRIEQADTGNRVIAWRSAEDADEPLVYVREHGRGRVCYLQFGHDLRAWNEPTIRTMIARAAQWVARDNDPERDARPRLGNVAIREDSAA